MENLSSESTLLVACRVKGLVLVSKGKILRFELAKLLGALLQLLGVIVELFLQGAKPCLGGCRVGELWRL